MVTSTLASVGVARSALPSRARAIPVTVLVTSGPAPGTPSTVLIVTAPPPFRRTPLFMLVCHLVIVPQGDSPPQTVPARKNTSAVAPESHRRGVLYVRQRPNLPHGPPCSTIGAERLNFRVRNGAGCFPLAMVTETLWRCSGPIAPSQGRVPDRISGTTQWTRSIFVGTSPRPISIGQLHALPHFHVRPITQWSAGGLTR